MKNPVVHFELIGPDPARLRSFYADLFGWDAPAGSPVAAQVSAPHEYSFISPAAGAPAAAGGIGGGPGFESHAVFYVGVANVSAALADAVQLGATVALPPQRNEGGKLRWPTFAIPPATSSESPDPNDLTAPIRRSYSDGARAGIAWRSFRWALAIKRAGTMRTRTIGSLSISVVRAAFRHRTNAHAAEMAFFGLLSLVPATITMGGILHVFARVGGPELATRGQEGASAAIRLLIGPKLADSVINPFVQTQLTQSRGLAVTGLLVTTWLTSRIFYALSHALDSAFDVSDPRRSLAQRCVCLAQAIGVVFVIAITLAIMVLGWRNGKEGMDHFLGQVPVVAQAWAVIRWPLLVAVLLGVIAALYRYGPNVRLSWRQCLPGAALAVLLWIAAAVAFRAYLLVGAGAPTGVQLLQSERGAHRPRDRRIDRHRALDVLLGAGDPDRCRTQRRAAARRGLRAGNLAGRLLPRISPPYPRCPPDPRRTRLWA